MRFRDVRRVGCGLVLAMTLGWSWLGGPSRAFAAPAADAIERFAIVPASSTASYRVAETFLANNRFNEAVGTTHAIQGEMAVDRAHPVDSVIGPIRVDLTTLASDDGRRDNSIRRRYLESSQYPTAEFTSTAIRGVPAPYPDGRSVQVEVVGGLVVRGVTKPVTFTGTVRLVGDTLTGTLSTGVLMTDFGFDPPSILGVLRAENQVTVTLQFVATRVPATPQ